MPFLHELLIYYRLFALVQDLASGRNFGRSTRNPTPVVDEMADLPKNASDKKHVKTRPKLFNTTASRQVSSQGCSRVFIGKGVRCGCHSFQYMLILSLHAVLHHVCNFVQGKRLPSIFTFPRDLVMSWLEAAKQDCIDCDLEFEEGHYGGPPFMPDDPSTHWSEPHQLYTWWKNNVERKTKFSIIVGDSSYHGCDERRVAR
jgi:hypothetical protein